VLGEAAGVDGAADEEEDEDELLPEELDELSFGDLRLSVR
jgi:hypothetical protein